ncbi:MAG: LytTR family transcriptional regulator DNA-binding domain-containing protein [Gammaproteobacteria bacterium]|nr:LytTR family transcriptional regulator DNA-binding domain-containing protein [Gammaproteobacteria bacterium]NNJ72946.1 response regulator [Enterobacterales bacterium]
MNTELSALIVDDEQLARDLIRLHLRQAKNVEVVGECNNGFEALDLILRKQPDIVFLDIQMPGLTGLEMIERLQADVMPLIVFTTAYDEFAVEAFKINAVDYLMKPIEYERVEEALERAMERKRTADEVQDKSQLLKALRDKDNRRRPFYEDQPTANNGKLAVSDSGTTNLIPYDDIEWIDAAGDYMCVHTKKETYIVRSTMKDLEEKLSAPFFQRIHRSTLVNFNKITKIEKLTKGEALLYTEEGASLKVSRNYRSCLERWQ